jgi:hypothetical protein
MQTKPGLLGGVPRPVTGWKMGEYLDYWLAQVAKLMVRPTTYARYEVMVGSTPNLDSAVIG